MADSSYAYRHVLLSPNASSSNTHPFQAEADDERVPTHVPTRILLARRAGLLCWSSHHKLHRHSYELTLAHLGKPGTGNVFFALPAPFRVPLPRICPHGVSCMARLARFVQSGTPYHVTPLGNRRQAYVGAEGYRFVYRDFTPVERLAGAGRPCYVFGQKCPTRACCRACAVRAR